MVPKSIADTTEKPTPPLTRAHRPHWMSSMSLSLVDAIAGHHHQSDHNQNVTRTLIESVRNLLVVDTCRRAKIEAEEIGYFLDTPQVTP